MILSAKLHIEGHQKEQDGIQLLTCDYSFSQEIDQKGLPTSRVRGGIVDITFVSLDDAEILQWMISVEADKNGEIAFSGDNNTKPFKTIKFKDARLIDYRESFSDKSELMVTLSISARELSISGVKYKNDWLGYDQ